MWNTAFPLPSLLATPVTRLVGPVAAYNLLVTLTLALFSLAATPENENHGVFLKVLRNTSSVRSLAVLIDESGYRHRLGMQPGAEARLDERRSAWRYFCRALELDAAFVDLSAPDLPVLERELERVLAAPLASN